MHRGDAGFERHRGGVEGRGGGAEDRHLLAAQPGEIDRVGGVGVAAPRQVLAQHRWDVDPAAAGNTVG